MSDVLRRAAHLHVGCRLSWALKIGSATTVDRQSIHNARAQTCSIDLTEAVTAFRHMLPEGGGDSYNQPNRPFSTCEDSIQEARPHLASEATTEAFCLYPAAVPSSRSPRYSIKYGGVTPLVPHGGGAPCGLALPPNGILHLLYSVN